MSATGGLLVLGAINVDLVVSGASLPKPGETVTDGEFAQHQGGKGGNQATAAARVLGAGRVAMLGAVGDDEDVGHLHPELVRGHPAPSPPLFHRPAKNPGRLQSGIASLPRRLLPMSVSSSSGRFHPASNARVPTEEGSVSGK